MELASHCRKPAHPTRWRRSSRSGLQRWRRHEILGVELGLSREEFAELRAKKIIGERPAWIWREVRSPGPDPNSDQG
jgi:hypothetical protein